MLPYYRGVGPEYIDNDYIQRLNKGILDTFKPKKRYAFFTICSWAKPYSTGYIHHSIRKALWENGLLDQVDYIHISSAGIIPAEAELWATLYDWNNAEIQDDITYELLRKRIEERLTAFLEKFGEVYDLLFFYIRPDGNTRKAIDATLRKYPEFEERSRFVFPPEFSTEDETSVKCELEQRKEYQIRPDADDILVCETVLDRATKLMSKHIKLSILQF